MAGDFSRQDHFRYRLFPYNDVLGAEESYWLGVQSARTALAAALAEMVSVGEVTEAQALELAHGYLHDNGREVIRRKGSLISV